AMSTMMRMAHTVTVCAMGTMVGSTRLERAASLRTARPASTDTPQPMSRMIIATVSRMTTASMCGSHRAHTLMDSFMVPPLTAVGPKQRQGKDDIFAFSAPLQQLIHRYCG